MNIGQLIGSFNCKKGLTRIGLFKMGLFFFPMKNDMHPRTRKVLYSLRLRKIFQGVFVKADDSVMEMLQKVEPYVTYGHLFCCPCLYKWLHVHVHPSFARIPRL